MNSIQLHLDGPVGRILIDNPKRKNALSRAMWVAIAQAVEQAMQHPEMRVLTLQSSTAGCFSAGADISEFESTHVDAQESLRANAQIRAAIDALASCPVPTIALIDGSCVGGGVAIALACDIRLASQRASFAITPTRLGLCYHPDDLSRLSQACGPAWAAEMLLTGSRWSAERALATGLVNQVFMEDAFSVKSESLIAAICANSLAATQAVKLGLAAALSQNPTAVENALLRFNALFEGPDFREGRAAFLEKRPAIFPSHFNRAAQ